MIYGFLDLFAQDHKHAVLLALYSGSAPLFWDVVIATKFIISKCLFYLFWGMPPDPLKSSCFVFSMCALYSVQSLPSITDDPSVRSPPGLNVNLAPLDLPLR